MTGVGFELRAAASAMLALGNEGTHPAGAVVGASVDGVDSLAAAGVARVADAGGPSRPMTVGTALDLASVTKIASTTALAMRLVADGSLDLDAPVATYLPRFASPTEGAGPRTAVTVRRLLEHTSGLPPWRPLYCRSTVRDEALDLAATTPLVAEPGTTWSYSDLGMIVLGAVLETVTGQRQDTAFAQRIARPLGLRHTAYGPTHPERTAASADSDVIEHRMVATGEPYPTDARVSDFDGWRTGTVVGEANDGNAAHALDGVAGHAGLFATIPELLVLGRSLVDRETVPESVIREFTTPLEIDRDHGLGFWLMTATIAGEQVPMAVHPGFTGTWLGVALDRDLVVAAAATRLHTTTGKIAAPKAGRTDLVGTSQITAVALAHLGAALDHHDAMPAPRHDAGRVTRHRGTGAA